MRKGCQVWLVQGCLLHTNWSGDALSADGPWGSIQWQCQGHQIVECLTHCILSVWCHRVEYGWLAISSDTSGEQLGKDIMCHNITTCSSVDLASEASSLIWSYFCRHGDSCPSVSKCINVDCSDVDVFWVNRGWGGHADRG